MRMSQANRSSPVRGTHMQASHHVCVDRECVAVSGQTVSEAQQDLHVGSYHVHVSTLWGTLSEVQKACSRAKGNHLGPFASNAQESVNPIKCPPVGRSGVRSVSQLYTRPLMPGWLLWHQHHRLLFDFSLLSSVQEKCRLTDYLLEIIPLTQASLLLCILTQSLTFMFS